MRLLPVLFVAAVLFFGVSAATKQKNGSLSHSPVLGAELSARRRKSEFQRNLMLQPSSSVATRKSAEM